MQDRIYPNDDRYIIRECVNNRTQLTQMANLILGVEPIDKLRLKKLAAQYREMIEIEDELRRAIRMRVAGPLPLWVEKYG